MITHALKYASEGRSVIPIGKDKRPLVQWQDFQTARASEKLIRKWWSDWPEANIGVVTGAISGITVVDVEKGGDVSYLPPTAIVRTGGGGYHFWYAYEKGVGNRARIRELTDIRGDGGYVVAPPSLHASGNNYAWELEAPLASFPKEILAITPTAQTDWREIVKGVGHGTRNDTAAKLIGKLMRTFAPEDWDTLVWQMAKDWNSKNEPPMPESELRATFESIAKRDARQKAQEAAPPKKDVKDVELVTFTEVVSRGYDELLKTKSGDIVSFGYDFLDEQLTGIFPGELVVLGGETGTGKTTLSTNIIYKASEKVPCCVFALEDRLNDYGIKALYYKIGQLRRQNEGRNTSNYSWNDYRRNLLKDDPTFQAYLNDARRELVNDNIFFVNAGTMLTVETLEKVIEEQTAAGVGLFLIDHLHYFDLFSDSQSKADYIESVMLRIKTLQNRTGARILLIVHHRKLNKQKPDLNSFKDSISIVQNANYVINLWRDRDVSKLERKGRDSRVTTTFVIQKARNPNGETKLEVVFDKEHGDYEDLALTAEKDKEIAELVVEDVKDSKVSSMRPAEFSY